MSSLAKSYLKVQYDLRPAKQVERRMMIDAFQILAAAGFPISDYQYTGFGSIHFVDFVLFHKFLGIKRMLSIENDSAIERRVRFNRPYRAIDIKIASAGEVIPELSSKRKHIVWLDYDQKINSDMLSDIAVSANTLSPGSILLVTMDAEPPGKEADRDYGPKMWHDHYSSVAGQYLGRYSSVKDFTESNLSRINAEVFCNVMRSSLISRDSMEFVPFLNLSYADGHRMSTCGGMICSPKETSLIEKSGLWGRTYVRKDMTKAPFEICVPKITRKERLFLDANMPSPEKWKPRPFEISNGELLAYREIYRYFPAYAEMML